MGEGGGGGGTEEWDGSDWLLVTKSAAGVIYHTRLKDSEAFGKY